jgi:hypothetical protein
MCSKWQVQTIPFSDTETRKRLDEITQPLNQSGTHGSINSNIPNNK